MGGQRKKKRNKAKRDRYSSGLPRRRAYPFAVSDLTFPLGIYGAKEPQRPSSNYIPEERVIPEGGCRICGAPPMPGEDTCYSHHSK
jgi:hypothetical protein